MVQLLYDGVHYPLSFFQTSVVGLISPKNIALQENICLDQNRFIPYSAVKVLKNRIVLIMRVNPDVRIVSMVSVNH